MMMLTMRTKARDRVKDVCDRVDRLNGRGADIGLERSRGHVRITDRRKYRNISPRCNLSQAAVWLDAFERGMDGATTTGNRNMYRRMESVAAIASSIYASDRLRANFMRRHE